MRFDSIHTIHLFWLVIFIGIFYVWAFKRRKKAIEAFVQRSLLPDMASSLSTKRQRWKAILIIAAISFSLLSLMRPQWGFHWEEVKRRGLDILIAIDTSKSMLANDVKPDRLERSKLAVRDLIKKLKGDRIGLIAFAGNAFLQCPLTVDYNGFLLSLDDLDISTIPKGGTSISSAIREGIKNYKGRQKKYKVMVIITDGEDHEGDPVKAAEEARKEGIKIFCIGIGTKEGELIQIEDDKGNKTFLKDRSGNFVKSRLDGGTLQKIALTTGGTYIRATGAEFGLDLIYEKKLSAMEKRELESKMRKHYEERFQIPLGIALLLLFLEPLVNERRVKGEG